ncbi:HGL174Cp [Eremothecium sinecaudum]|uniref:HGL174Cp n=1 Tax=Eremothecium sinecaudum TaxID=45286 RepID=A0A0X8HUU8_9SACH|nr:HGL174Cp [Eremothecium sinecaudum]AMD22166.1 HGL174Cp [Eremothecium sinecaudum]
MKIALLLRQVIKFVIKDANIEVLGGKIFAILKIEELLQLWGLLRTGRLAKLARVLERCGALPALLVLYPLAVKVKGEYEWLSWNGTMLLSMLPVAPSLPDWAVSLASTECVLGVLSKRLTFVRRWFENMTVETRILIRQALISVCIPLLRRVTVNPGPVEQWLFGKRSILHDFLIFYSAWNVASIYKFVKQSLYRVTDGSDKRKDRARPSSHHADIEPSNVNSKHLLYRLREMDELSTKKYNRYFDRLLSCTIRRNFTICMKWALWRRSINWLFNCNTSYMVGHLQKSVVIMLTFLILNGDEYLSVNTDALKYLFHCIVTQKLGTLDPSAKYFLLLAGLNFELYNVQRLVK